MTSQPGLQTIAIHVLPNISQRKGNQTIKFGQLVEHNKKHIFLQMLCGKWGRKTSSRPLFIFWKSLIWCESKWSASSFHYIAIPLNLPYNKSKLYKTLDYWSSDITNFNFSEKGLGLVSPPHFVHDFSRKMFLMLLSINRPNFIVWLPLLLEILGNMFITIACWPDCDVIKFEIKLITLIKPFWYMTKKSRQKLKHLENGKSFWSEIKIVFHHF